MKSKIEAEVQPFTVPSHVYFVVPCATKAEGYSASIPLPQVDALTLDALCNDFRRAVFEKAKVEQPPREGCGQCGRALA